MSSTPTPANSGVNWNCLMWHPKPLKLLSDMYDRTIADKRRQLLATWVNNRSVQEAFGSVASLHQSQDQDDTHYEELWKELVTACGKETIDNYPLCTKCSTRDCEETRSLWSSLISDHPGDVTDPTSAHECEQFVIYEVDASKLDSITGLHAFCVHKRVTDDAHANVTPYCVQTRGYGKLPSYSPTVEAHEGAVVRANPSEEPICDAARVALVRNWMVTNSPDTAEF